MRDADLAKLFAWVAGSLVLGLFGAWVTSQGGSELADLFLFVDISGAPGRFMTLVLVGVLAGFAGFIGFAYARRRRGEHWTHRVPPVKFDPAAGPLPPPDLAARMWVIAVVIATTAFPVAGMVHFGSKILKDALIWNEGLPVSTAISVRAFLPAFMSSAKETERTCAAAVWRHEKKAGEPGRLWLAARQCDVARFNGMTPAPFEIKRGTFTPQEAEAERQRREAAAAAIAAACRFAFDPTTDCRGYRDYSRLCLKGEYGERCRGIEFLREVTPTIGGFAVLFGLSGVVAFLFGVLGFGGRPPLAQAQPASAGGKGDVVATD